MILKSGFGVRIILRRNGKLNLHGWIEKLLLQREVFFSMNYMTCDIGKVLQCNPRKMIKLIILLFLIESYELLNYICISL